MSSVPRILLHATHVFHGVLAPRAKLRARIVPKLPPTASCVASASPASGSGGKEASAKTEERPRARDRGGDIIPTAPPVGATTLARTLDGAAVLMPNVLSAKHLGRIGGGLLYAATSNVPWAT